MADFRVPEDMSTCFRWPVDGPWYTMSWSDAQRLDRSYKGGDPRGPTHSEKLALIERLGWETCVDQRGMVHVRAPGG